MQLSCDDFLTIVVAKRETKLSFKVDGKALCGMLFCTSTWVISIFLKIKPAGGSV